MSQVAAEAKTAEKAPVVKKIKKLTRAPVRLWVRAKFLGFRRYWLFNTDPRFNKTKTRLSCDSKVSTIARLPHGTSAREWSTYGSLQATRITSTGLSGEGSALPTVTTVLYWLASRPTSRLERWEPL